MTLGTVAYMSPEQARGQDVDARSDLFSLGVMLYEMSTGRLPFPGNTAAEIFNALLSHSPAPLSGVPPKLQEIILWCLEKDRSARYQKASEVRADLERLTERPRAVPPIKSLVLALLIVSAAGGWLWHRSSRERWVRETLTPEIATLVDEGEFEKAAVLVRQARAVLPNDPTLEKLWMLSTADATIETEPPGAEVSIRPYGADANAWENLGTTPLQKVRVPKDEHLFRIVKAGFAPQYVIDSWPVSWTLKLRPETSVPEEMLVIPGAETRLGWPYGEGAAVELDDFLIDRHEVTNEEYKKFVDAGGYQKRELWREPFVKDGREVSWEEAMNLFVDGTGRPGPSTWEVGSYPKGMEKHPVAGVSWYEAAAYCELVDKSLPTAYHWTWASENGSFTAAIVVGSNFKSLPTETSE